jgi:hypothetical protein
VDSDARWNYTCSNIHFWCYCGNCEQYMKDRLGDQRGGSEWEPIKILLDGAWNSNNMNPFGPTPEVTHSALLPFICQNHCWRCILVPLACSLHFGLDLIMELIRH